MSAGKVKTAEAAEPPVVKAKLHSRFPIFTEVSAERNRQDAKWGGVPGVDRLDDHTYAAVLGEEFGECCKAWLERDLGGLRVELVQLAACAVAWIEEINNHGRARP